MLAQGLSWIRSQIPAGATASERSTRLNEIQEQDGSLKWMALVLTVSGELSHIQVIVPHHSLWDGIILAWWLSSARRMFQWKQVVDAGHFIAKPWKPHKVLQPYCADISSHDPKSRESASAL